MDKEKLIQKLKNVHNLIILTFSLFSFESYGNMDKWPFLTTPMLQPKFEISLCDIVGEELVFKLLHELRFDGEKYESHIFVSGLNTFLVESGFNELRLKTVVSGNEIIFHRYDGAVEFDNTMWHVYRNLKSNTLFLSADYNKLYHYRGSFLKNSIINNSIYKYNYKKSSIGSVLKVTDRGARYIVRRIDNNGMRYKLEIGNCAYIIEKNNQNQITSFCSEDSEDLILQLEYDNKLLSEVNHNGIKTKYNWMIAKVEEYVKPPLPIPPVVSNDGKYEYKAVWKHFKFIVSYESHIGNRKGSWVVDSREDEIKLKSKELDLK